MLGVVLIVDSVFLNGALIGPDSVVPLNKV